MRLIISPAKRMRTDADSLDPALLARPALLDRAARLLDWMRQAGPDALRGFWACNEQIARANLERVAAMDLGAADTPAILAYDGIQYQAMAPAVFEESQLAYVQRHLRVLSGLYGVLRPMDAVTPYRLEMGSRLPDGLLLPGGARTLYEFWGDEIVRQVMAGEEGGAGEASGAGGQVAAGEQDAAADGVVVNLASREYARCVTDHLAAGRVRRLVTCVFGEMVAPRSGGEPRLAQRSTHAKMARGEMVRYAAAVGAGTPEDLRGFDRMGYALRPDLGDDDTLVFVRDTQVPVRA